MESEAIATNVNRKIKRLFKILLGIALVLALPITLFRLKYHRSVVFRDLSVASTQTVSVTFAPMNIRWKISGELQGTGIVVVPFVYSNTVNGSFSAHGSGDYYTSNVSVIFIPAGNPSGTVRASFRLDDFHFLWL